MPSLLDDLPDTPGPKELVDLLLEREVLRIERIVSHGHTAPEGEGEFYDQEWSEFVLLVTGAATIEFPETRGEVALKSGDWIEISAHEKHRVSWTTPEEPSVWLAVHFRE